MKCELLADMDLHGGSPSPRREWIEITIAKFYCSYIATSPSPRREWIEILDSRSEPVEKTGLPPHGGSGLKYLWFRQYERLRQRLPPHGGSGLKSQHVVTTMTVEQGSPSPRREWIEIFEICDLTRVHLLVSLPTEGVD